MIEGVVGTLLDRLADVFLAPYYFKDMLWIITPLFLTMILVELYFARYKFEEMGWHTAYANALVLFFVSIDLFRVLYYRHELTYITMHNVLVIGLAILGVLLAVTNYLHFWSKDFAYGISNQLPINLVAYMGVILVYSNIPIDIYTIIISVGMLFLFMALILGLRIIIPKAIELDETEYKERRNAPSP